MKNTVQVHRKGGTKRPSSQLQTGRSRKPAEENVYLVIKDSNGEDFTDFEIPKAKYDAMLASAKHKGITFSQWMENACREKLGIQATQAETKNGFHVTPDLENAKNQSNALLQLLAGCMDNQNHNGHWSQEFGDEMCAGIQELVTSTRDRLSAAFDATLKALHSQRNEVRA